MTLRWSDQGVMPVGALTELQVLPPGAANEEYGLHLIKGILSFFHRDKPSRIRIITSGVQAGVDGTEFVMSVDTSGPVERTTMSVIDGKVRFYNDQGSLTLTNMQQAVAETGKPPVPTRGFVANNILQWCFYYPAVLDLSELPLTAEEKSALTDSLGAYRAGDLLVALRSYPAGRPATSDAEKLYYAALLLSVGQIEQTESALAALATAAPGERIQRLAAALRQLIAAVKLQAGPPNVVPQLSTELLAGSYYEQSLGHREISLRAALDLARRAATNSPNFGFAWERVAELEFSFGNTDRALEALDRSLTLSPRNAQALALKGFLLAAQNKESEAVWWFEDALTVDPGLANAWLGRGLCRIRRGNFVEGREDLMVAAALEPQRAFLRSYLGKAYAEEGDFPRATKELDLAKRLDKNDPTAWLYSALLNQQYNRVNEAIGDLEHSQDLNDNRSVYRSSLLLDQDRAVRSANLAGIYRDAGMFDVSVREAVRAVSYDYANYSAHLFLANSYDELRDPNRINLRYETPAETEYLIANLLAPVGAGTLSPTVSQQEYSKLFEHDRLGIASSTEYLSRGAWDQQGVQYGIFGNSSYAFEASYRSDPGQRANNDFEERVLAFHFKQELTDRDSVYLRTVWYDAAGGDLTQYPDPSFAYPDLRTVEKQEPSISLGYHHEWSPGMHTLVLASRLEDDYSVLNPQQPSYFIIKPMGGTPVYAEQIRANLDYHNSLEIYSTEAQQIWEQGTFTTVIGGRFQIGEFQTQNLQTDPTVQGDILGYFNPNAPLAQQNVHSEFDRISFYAYENWRILPRLLVVGGLAYDWIHFPENFRSPPISQNQDTIDHLSPKAGFIWTLGTNSVVRFAYARALAGASIDQTFLLEPTLVAGFNQSFRSIIPESEGGANAAARFETYGLAFEQRFPTHTYLGIQGQILNSKVDRTLGAFEYTGESFFAQPSGTPDSLNYTERSLLVTVNQLLGNEWSVGANYRLTQADLNDTFADIPNDLDQNHLIGFHPRQDLSAILHRVGFQTIFSHSSGVFVQLEALWYNQHNQGYSPALPSSDFWQVNAFLGYRFPRRKAELRVGLLNLTDQDYRLNPLTLYNELPRERTFAARLQFSF
jgi:tetratricopeptide (TPR) repeat protein